ncbi:alpha/beta hydrolase family protein [Maritalea sp.]|uniref:alpha/beta hydrolase family protein n=1 Tax=Maritalea sp. TaxID=2003361 RepID=UPI003EF6DACC
MKLRHISFGAGALVGLVLLALTIWFLVPDTRTRAQEISFEFEGKRVVGKMMLPLKAQTEPINCLVFVHGDGAMPYDGLGYFDPYFSQFAEQGWCSFSWDKPGVGASEGNWLDFNMQDRADMVMAGLDALRANPNVEIGKIGLIGFSQAGWVMPKISADAADISFYIFVSPAVNWMQQSAYMTSLRHLETPIELAVKAVSDQLDMLLLEGKPFEDFEKLAAKHDSLDPSAFTKDRWQFAVRNANADLTEDLANLTNHPVLLFAGGRDGQVDAEQSVETFRHVLGGDQLQVQTYASAGHSMVEVDERRPMTDWDGIVLLTKVVFGGSDAFVEGYWATMEKFIAAQFAN